MTTQGKVQARLNDVQKEITRVQRNLHRSLEALQQRAVKEIVAIEEQTGVDFQNFLKSEMKKVTEYKQELEALYKEVRELNYFLSED